MRVNSQAISLSAISLLLCVAALVFLPGCSGKPNAANIELRKQVQRLESEVDSLRKNQAADRATIAQLRQARGGAVVTTLSDQRLAELVTVHSIRIVEKSTAGEDTDPQQPGDEGFVVLFSPVDADGDEVKAAGELTVQLFDLAKPDNMLGTWTLPWSQLKQTWVSGFFLEGFMVKRPWQTRPASRQLVVRLSFVESLTGRVFTAQQNLNVSPD